MKKLNKEIIISVVIISLALVIFGYIQYKSKIETLKFQKEEQQTKILEQKRQENLKKANLDDCFEEAYNAYSYNWNSQCEIAGLGDNCLLYKYQREDIEKDWEDSKDRCVQMFK